MDRDDLEIMDCDWDELQVYKNRAQAQLDREQRRKLGKAEQEALKSKSNSRTDTQKKADQRADKKAPGAQAESGSNSNKGPPASKLPGSAQCRICKGQHAAQDCDKLSTEICKDFNNGKCSFGNQCTYRHALDSTPKTARFSGDLPAEGEDANTSKPPARSDRTRQIPCFFFAHGNCEKGDKCDFSHGASTPAAGKTSDRTTLSMENQSDSDQEDELDGDMQYYYEGYTTEGSDGPTVEFTIEIAQPAVDFDCDQLESESSESDNDQLYDSIALVALNGIGETLAELNAPDKWINDCAEPADCNFQDAELSPIQPDALRMQPDALHSPALESPGPTDQARWAFRVQMKHARHEGNVWTASGCLNLSKLLTTRKRLVH